VREEIEHIRRGKHPKPGTTSERTRRSAVRSSEVGQGERAVRAPSKQRSKAIRSALDREPRSSATPRKLARQAKRTARSTPRKTRATRTTARQRKAAR
jgi:hypothetical protein